MFRSNSPDTVSAHYEEAVELVQAEGVYGELQAECSWPRSGTQTVRAARTIYYSHPQVLLYVHNLFF